MNTVVIACKAMERELSAAMAQTGRAFPVVWIEAGLHNVPAKLHRAVQAEIDRHGDWDRILRTVPTTPAKEEKEKIK